MSGGERRAAAYAKMCVRGSTRRKDCDAKCNAAREGRRVKERVCFRCSFLFLKFATDTHYSPCQLLTLHKELTFILKTLLDQ